MFHHTVVRFLILEMSNTRQLQLYSLNQSTIDYSNKTLLATVSVTDGSQAATALIGSGDRGNDFRIFSSTTNIFYLWYCSPRLSRVKQHVFPDVPGNIGRLLFTKSSLFWMIDYIANDSLLFDL